MKIYYFVVSNIGYIGTSAILGAVYSVLELRRLIVSTICFSTQHKWSLRRRSIKPKPFKVWTNFCFFVFFFIFFNTRSHHGNIVERLKTFLHISYWLFVRFIFKDVFFNAWGTGKVESSTWSAMYTEHGKTKREIWMNWWFDFESEHMNFMVVILTMCNVLCSLFSVHFVMFTHLYGFVT